MNFETIKVQEDGPVGRLGLNRPESLNPLSRTTLRELEEAARWFDKRPGVRVVIVSVVGITAVEIQPAKAPAHVELMCPFVEDRAPP